MASAPAAAIGPHERRRSVGLERLFPRTASKFTPPSRFVGVGGAVSAGTLKAGTGTDYAERSFVIASYTRFVFWPIFSHEYRSAA